MIAHFFIPDYTDEYVYVLSLISDRNVSGPFSDESRLLASTLDYALSDHCVEDD